MNCSNSSWSFLLGWYEIVCCIFKTRLSGKIMAFLGKKMGNNHLHYIQAIFISKKLFRVGENFVVFLLVSNHNCNKFCNTYCWCGACIFQTSYNVVLFVLLKSKPLSIFQNKLLPSYCSRAFFPDQKLRYHHGIKQQFWSLPSRLILTFHCCFIVVL